MWVSHVYANQLFLLTFSSPIFPTVSTIAKKKSRAYTPAEQTTTAISAVRDALDNLDHLFGTIEDTYRTSLMSSGIEREPAPTSGASSRKEFSA